MILNFLHNFVRTAKKDLQNIVEIGEGDDSAATSAKSTKKATVNNQYGIAVGHDNFVDEDYGIAIGAFQKVLEKHGIAEGGYYNKVDKRYGEKRRTFADNNNLYSRSWFEWQGVVDYLAEPPGPAWSSIFLHGQLGLIVELENYSAMVFNIKVVGTDGNSTPNVVAYHMSGAIKRGANAASTAIVGAVTKTAWEDVATMDCQVIADTTTGGLDLQVTTHATNNYKWAAAGWCTELRFTI